MTILPFRSCAKSEVGSSRWSSSALQMSRMELSHVMLSDWTLDNRFGEQSSCGARFTEVSPKLNLGDWEWKSLESGEATVLYSRLFDLWRIPWNWLPCFSSLSIEFAYEIQGTLTFACLYSLFSLGQLILATHFRTVNRKWVHLLFLHIRRWRGTSMWMSIIHVCLCRRYFQYSRTFVHRSVSVILDQISIRCPTKRGRTGHWARTRTWLCTAAACGNCDWPGFASWGIDLVKHNKKNAKAYAKSNGEPEELTDLPVKWVPTLIRIEWNSKLVRHLTVEIYTTFDKLSQL